MKLVFLFLLFLIFSVNTSAQVKNLETKGNHFLFTYKKSTYLIENDTLHNVSYSQKGFPKLHSLPMKEFKFFETPSIGYLKNASSGIVFSFDGNQFKRVDHSFDFKNQFRSYTFFHHGFLMDFGGYGLHSFKNIITYYNFAKKETELYNQKTPISESPIARDRMLAQYSKGNLFIGQGHGIPSAIEQPYQNAGLISDYWKFSFQDNSWTKLGEGLTEVVYPYDVLYEFNNHALVISDKCVFEADIENNQLISYPNANFSIIKSLNKNNTLSTITFNPSEKGFYFVIDKSNDKSEVLFVKKVDFLGTKKVYSKLYSTNSNLSGVFLFFVIILIVILVFYYYKSKKSSIHRIEQKINTIEKYLKQEDIVLLNLLISAYPKYINYSTLLDLYPHHLGYESKKKKIRQSIIEIEDCLIRIAKIEGPVFLFRKNIEDKREKQIRIR